MTGRFPSERVTTFIGVRIAPHLKAEPVIVCHEPDTCRAVCSWGQLEPEQFLFTHAMVEGLDARLAAGLWSLVETVGVDRCEDGPELPPGIAKHAERVAG